MRRIVIKIGTQVIISQSQGGVDRGILQSLALTVAELKKAKLDTILVTSGAVGLGRIALKLKPPLTIAEKQACAAIGQGQLMKLYESALSSHNLICAQILVTIQEFSQRHSFNHLRDTFETLLKFGVIPIVNENDSVSTSELSENEQASFGDNDKLSAIVGSKIDADLLVILTNVDGVYTKNPNIDKTAERISIIDDVRVFQKIEAIGGSELGRGGMITKLEAARMASICGVPVLITNLESFSRLRGLGRETEIESLQDHGTLVLPDKKLKGKKKWIGAGSGFRASVVINEGAKKALIERNASLLVVGTISTQGEFQAGDVISVRDELGAELARGIARVDSSKAAIERTGVLIHKDELALLIAQEEESK